MKRRRAGISTRAAFRALETPRNAKENALRVLARALCELRRFHFKRRRQMHSKCTTSARKTRFVLSGVSLSKRAAKPEVNRKRENQVLPSSRAWKCQKSKKMRGAVFGFCVGICAAASTRSLRFSQVFRCSYNFNYMKKTAREYSRACNF